MTDTDRQHPLFIPHRRALTVLYADLESHALNQREVFVGTAGSVIERTNASGFRFYTHQFYDGEGRKRERYLAGPVGDPKADAAAADLRERIRELKEIVPSLRLLGREGFNLADAKTYATLASLHNHGVFAAGGMLIGSHAYGVLLNRLGVRATPYATEDIDIARRREALAFEKQPEQGLLEMLKDTGIPFVEVPSLNRKKPPTSFKQRGRSRFHVDLLVPSANEDFPVVPVPELRAYATGLPYLDCLLAESQTAMLMAREGCCPVRVPLPERFAVHKLIVSRLRSGREAKSDKDVFQACVLCAALAESHPGAIESAVAQIPRRAKKYLAPAIEAAHRLLAPVHARAWEELSEAAKP
ncbi:MAG: GSU2403 family nucleotidyltransferase fold protein [Sulfuricaulis sp.]|uniref:GSU2403 family nucleotidyltransferase fold protein n=1 Tax=Sulfuricaulis sp. TaxID=2003553 RepID=UPI0034A583F5